MINVMHWKDLQAASNMGAEAELGETGSKTNWKRVARQMWKPGTHLTTEIMGEEGFKQDGKMEGRQAGLEADSQRR